ncbi:DUF4292 domain-containing protein [Antarcticibacterium flavum]|uniref:DUF4292 domain-containing protein n=1 Tax=Antarcticibacterium flavum TaxID=2058175 RepID=A0A5B7X4A3_9FLAO|nr:MULTISPECIES: DUF4292 domain-containing protein [Antarcticibacterium]MCM4159174.1 DUF4292 domain-containing protein [Antarcticibacterium sp. W02-3]QCY69572.1 DUF4292 domain-containing protein [Antarcticibacterium flavum]
MIRKIVIILVVTLFTASCGSRKKAAEIEDAATAEVITRHYDNQADFKTLSSRMRLNYQDEERSQSVTVSFRMEKDETIWISAQLLGIPLAKALITRDRVSYFEKIGKTYFDGDYSLLSKWLGTPLDYDKLQNLLLGQAIYDLREDRYVLTESSRGYQLVPANGAADAIRKMFLLDPQNYKASAQQLNQDRENRNVTVTYPKYQRVSGRTLPEEIKIVANEGGRGTNIDISLRSVSFNENLNFPFEIPSGYDEIVID